MRVLVACEFSGTVRDAFRARGHDATSADLLPTERPGPHHQGDVLEILDAGWDLMVAHPPCTDLAVSGARWFQRKRDQLRLPGFSDDLQGDALAFVRALLEAPIPRIAIENPVSIISSRIRPPDQIIQPWQFGTGETKATCLWLKGLPPLEPTELVAGRTARVHLEPPGRGRWRERSRTFPGIAAAMADQWGWEPVTYRWDCTDDICPRHAIDYAECACPGPHQDDLYEYRTVAGRLEARPLLEDEPRLPLGLPHR